jgi:hypothetical protein
MATTGKWTTRSTGKATEDPSGLGRWSGLTYLGKQNKRLTVLTAYRSPRQQPSAGFGFYDQQYALLLSKGICKPNVRRQFITDLTKLINDLQSAGHEILLSLDANEILGQDKTFGIGHLLDECTLADLHCLGPALPPATYKYGADRKIDFMLGSPAVANCIRSAGFLAYDNGIFSKHRGLFIDLDFQELMRSVDSISPAPARRLNSENQVSVDRYLEAFKKYADDHKIDERVSELVILASSLSLFHNAKQAMTPLIVISHELCFMLKKRPNDRLANMPGLQNFAKPVFLPYIGIYGLKNLRADPPPSCIHSQGFDIVYLL